MKKTSFLLFIQALFLFSALSISSSGLAQSTKDRVIIEDADSARADFIRTDLLMKSLFDSAYGYVIFPNIGKGAIGVGGAAGNGIVYEKGAMIGKASMKQVTIGFQFGGQAYREVIFFENKETLDRFREDKIEFSAEASAVAATVGAAAHAKYTNGIMIFTQLKGGLMYEASVGGQKFNYTAF
ncbi:MAG TPA: YSC84-related protein [Parafilimonas sp.]|jgi:lipid-binding SYLF domain-containing protein|nr:YSC84-related protein [Parafilimonas sp.]